MHGLWHDVFIIVTSIELVKGIVSLMVDVKKVFLDSLRMYFAPLTGAFKAIRAEMARMDRHHRSKIV